MKDASKREHMKDVLQQLGYVDEGQAVIEDSKSGVSGPDPARASVVKMLLDEFGDKLKSVGLHLGSVGLNWKTDDSASLVYQKLRQLQLISRNESALQ